MVVEDLCIQLAVPEVLVVVQEIIQEGVGQDQLITIQDQQHKVFLAALVLVTCQLTPSAVVEVAPVLLEKDILLGQVHQEVFLMEQMVEMVLELE